MRYALLLVVLALAGCGDDKPFVPTIPPTPPPPTYPNMLGGWAGTQADTYVDNDGRNPGGRTCNESWLITSQQGGVFSGAFQRTAGSSDVCSRSGTVSGSVLVSGEIQFDHTGTGVSGGCAYVAGNQPFSGVLSAAGNITAGTLLILRCPRGNGTVDVRFTTSVSVSRR